jgi:hypothetical protein
MFFQKQASNLDKAIPLIYYGLAAFEYVEIYMYVYIYVEINLQVTSLRPVLTT